MVFGANKLSGIMTVCREQMINDQGEQWDGWGGGGEKRKV